MRNLKTGKLNYEPRDVDRYPDRMESSIQPARYVKRPVMPDNPDLCALPTVPDNERLLDEMHLDPAGYDFEEISAMPLDVRKESVAMIKNVRAAMPLDLEMARILDDALVDSYMGRYVRIHDGSGMIPDDGASGVLSVRNKLAGRPHFFLIHGSSGCGKTSSLNMALSRYPEAVHHVFENEEYLHLPALVQSAKVGNMSAMSIGYAQSIDRIVGGSRWETMMGKARTVGRQMQILGAAIAAYHIGILIIDEAQYLKFDTGNSSVENLISLSEETGIALGFVANNDLIPKIIKHPRFMTRCAQAMVEVKIETKMEKDFFRLAAEQMWRYQFTKTYTEMTPEIMAELERDSLYNIAILKVLIMLVQSEALKKQQKNGITPEFIHNVSEKKLTRIRTVLLEDDSDGKFQKELDLLYSDMGDTSKARTAVAGRAYLKEREKENAEWGVGKLDEILTVLKFCGIEKHLARQIIKKLQVRIPDLPKLDSSEVIRLVLKDQKMNDIDTKAVIPGGGTSEKEIQNAVNGELRKAVNE